MQRHSQIEPVVRRPIRAGIAGFTHGLLDELAHATARLIRIHRVGRHCMHVRILARLEARLVRVGTTLLENVSYGGGQIQEHLVDKVVVRVRCP